MPVGRNKLNPHPGELTELIGIHGYSNARTVMKISIKCLGLSIQDKPGFGL